MVQASIGWYIFITQLGHIGYYSVVWRNWWLGTVLYTLSSEERKSQCITADCRLYCCWWPLCDRRRRDDLWCLAYLAVDKLVKAPANLRTVLGVCTLHQPSHHHHINFSQLLVVRSEHVRPLFFNLRNLNLRSSYGFMRQRALRHV